MTRSQLPDRRPAFFYQPLSSGKPRSGLRKALQCEQVPLSRLAQRFGTPLYVYSATMIRQRAQAFDRAFRSVPHTICYSVKANSNLSILRLLARLGCGFDVVSGGELERVLRAAGRAGASRTVFSGVGKTRDEMRAALKAGILLFNVESESELAVLAECASQLKRRAPLALRVNPDVPANTHPYISTGLHRHKFGVPVRQARDLYREAAGRKFLQVAGVSVHIGSQITDVSTFTEALEPVAALITTLRQDGHAIRYVDTGGGLGIAYQAHQQRDFSSQIRAYAAAVMQPLRGLRMHLLLEPGRAIVGPAGTLLTRVLFRKKNGKKTFSVVDAAMNDLLRPALYDAHHEIAPVELEGQPAKEIVDVVGPICESGDFLARGRELPVTVEGDLLAVLDAGAYGMSLASNYNTRPRAAEVLVEDGSVKLIRRRESIADLLGAETRTG